MLIKCPGIEVYFITFSIAVIFLARITSPIYATVAFPESSFDQRDLMLDFLLGAEVDAAQTEGHIKFLVIL